MCDPVAGHDGTRAITAKPAVHKHGAGKAVNDRQQLVNLLTARGALSVHRKIRIENPISSGFGRFFFFKQKTAYEIDNELYAKFFQAPHSLRVRLGAAIQVLAYPAKIADA